MTKQLIFSFFDQKSEAYMQPWFSPTRAHALRTFADAIQDPATLIGKHPEDFFLFELGSFDVASGDITLEKVSLGNGVQFSAQARLKEVL